MRIIFAVLKLFADAVFGFFGRRFFAYHRAGWPTDDFDETSNPGFGVCPECMRIEHRDLRFSAQPVEIDDAGSI
jgi:hypothetical protein